MSIYRVLLLSVGLAGFIGLAGCASDAQPPPRTSQSVTPPPTTSSIVDTPPPATQSTLSADSVRRITPIELRQVLAQAIVVDVRSEDTYAASHIKGARSIPLSEVSSRAGELPRDKMIVTYCS